MRPHIVIRYIGLALLFNALFLLIASIVSFLKSDTALFPLLYSSIVAALIGVFPMIFVLPTHDIRNDEGLVIVVASWLLSSVIGALPYILWGGEFTLTNAWFESISGFTTTGSSILTNVEAIPAGLLFWRSTTHWIGGIGIIIFMLAVLPSTGKATMILYKSEISALAIDSFQYRTKKTLQIILVVYVGLTLLETLGLFLLGMNLFDAITHSFATIATGGFSTKNTSIAYYNNWTMELFITFFMIVSGINFGLIFVTVTGSTRKILQSTTVKYYLGALVIGCCLVAVNVHGKNYYSWLESIRFASFQVVSVGTSTGFANADSELWPGFSKLILIFFTFQCACVGSTSGGIKVDRLVILWKSIGMQLKRIRHPKAVFAMRMDGNVMAPETIDAVILYILIYIVIVFASGLGLTAFGVDILSAFSGSAAAMGNVGPGFGIVSSLGNFSQIPDAGKWILSFVMLLGRLEIFGLLMFFIYRFMR